MAKKNKLSQDELQAMDVAYLLGDGIVGKEAAIGLRADALERYRREPGGDSIAANRGATMTVAGMGALEACRLLEEAMPGQDFTVALILIARDRFRAQKRMSEALSCQVLIDLEMASRKEAASKVVLTDAAGFAKPDPVPDLMDVLSAQGSRFAEDVAAIQIDDGAAAPTVYQDGRCEDCDWTFGCFTASAPCRRRPIP
jgi:hypothetical protein